MLSYLSTCLTQHQCVQDDHDEDGAFDVSKIKGKLAKRGATGGRPKKAPEAPKGKGKASKEPEKPKKV